jgi:hypothetical protein
MIHSRRASGTFLALSLVLPTAVAFSEDPSTDPLVLTTPHFAFYSDFETNLNDALIVAGVDRNKGGPELFRADSDEASCFEALSPSTRKGWDLAVDFYAEVVSPRSWMSRQQYVLRMQLGGFDDELDESSATYRSIADGMRMAAAPAYRRCDWPSQDSKNRGWIDRLAVRLAAHEAEITDRLTKLYQTPWRGLPIRVDIVSTALPVGANTYHTPPHIVISSETQDSDALEIIHHEASHTLMRREDPVYRALAEAARDHDMELPRDLWHVVLFYTTGEAVRRTLAESGEPDYTPYIYRHDLWDGRWGAYQGAVEDTWPAYLDGRRSLPATTSDLLESLKEQGSVE